MGKINSLTKEQEKKIAEYRDMGIRMGLCTDRVDREKALEYGKRLMGFLGRDHMATIVMDGPIHSWFAVCMLSGNGAQVGAQVWAQVRDQVWDQVWAQVRAQVWDQVGAQVRAQVGAQVRDQVWAQVWDQVWDQVGAQVRAQVGAQVRDQVWAQVGDQVWAQVRDQVWDQVGDQVRAQVGAQVRAQVWDQVGAQVRDQVWAQVGDKQPSFIWPWLDGQFLSHFVAWAKYYRDVIGLNLTDYSIIEDQCHFGLVYPLEKFVVICDRPISILKNENGLHCDSGPSVEYADGTKIWSLNGVNVPDWLAEKPVSEIDCREFSKIKNVEVRREFIRKVGIERICEKLGSKVLDKIGDVYELHLIDLGGETGEWPYLKMLNPSIGVWHMECVPQEIKTVQEALNWRNQSELVPEQLT